MAIFKYQGHTVAERFDGAAAGLGLAESLRMVNGRQQKAAAALSNKFYLHDSWFEFAP